MPRKQPGSPQAAGPELRRRYLAGGGLAALGLLLMLAAFHPDTSDLVMQWVSPTYLAIARCLPRYQHRRQWATLTSSPISTAYPDNRENNVNHCKVCGFSSAFTWARLEPFWDG